ncbi:hypothetical protein Fcan01_16720 [Folsomia candida]|uniref:Uncharacterized protein n=1 Tax=Folsomia candida TaxID=158441 RepID=A0A226DUX2_FOLCA|nr:hypothetical protein Fcan01_16720 [Folsomia candida]
MPSQKALKQLGFWIKLSHNFLRLPISWNKTDLKVELCKKSSKTPNLSFCTLVSVLFFQLVYLLGQMYKIIGSDTTTKCFLDPNGQQSCHGDYIVTSWIIIYTQAYFWSGTVVVNIWMNSREVVGLVNSVYSVGNRIENAVEQNLPPSSRNSRQFDTSHILLLVCKGAFLEDWMACSAAAIMHPSGPQFLSSLAEDKICTFVLILFSVVCVTLVLISMFFEFAIISFYLIFVIKTLRLIGKSSLSTKSKFRYYTQLQILNKIQNISFFYRIPHLVWTLSVVTILGNFGTIRLHGVLGTFDLFTMIVLAILGFAILLTALHYFGSVANESAKFVGVIKPLVQLEEIPKLQQRFHAALRYSFFVRGTMLTSSPP